MVLTTSAKQDSNILKAIEILHCQDLVKTLNNTNDLPEKCQSYSSVIEALNQKNSRNNSKQKEEEIDVVALQSNNDMTTTVPPVIQEVGQRSLAQVRNRLSRRNTSNRVRRRDPSNTDL